jgi:hypothetical protein
LRRRRSLLAADDPADEKAEKNSGYAEYDGVFAHVWKPGIWKVSQGS